MTSIDNLLLRINDVHMEELIPVTLIKDEEDVKKYQEKGYIVDCTIDKFKETFEGVDISCVYYTPSISAGLIYFNKETMAAMNFPFRQMVGSNKFTLETIKQAIEHIEESVSNNNYFSSINVLPDGMRMDYFKMLVAKKGSFPGLYSLFMSFYNLSDYGFNKLDEDLIKTVLNSKTEEEKEATRNALEDFPEVVTIYRGGNSASSPYEKAYSWTLDINVANFFASRRGSEKGYIATGTINKGDIIEIYKGRDEEEVIVNPAKVTVKEVIDIYGLKYIEENAGAIKEIYQEYRNLMTSTLSFSMDSEIHGKKHQARVLFLSLLIANHLRLSKKDMDKLALAAIFHDTRRDNEGEDVEHGKSAAYYYHSVAKAPIPCVEFLCEYHSKPDIEGYKALRKNKVLRDEIKKNKLLFEIFKDADALDRVRFGIRGLDIDQLRLDISKKLTVVARLCFEQIEV